MRTLVNNVCAENNIENPSQVSLGYDFKNKLPSLKNIGEFKLKIKELEFLIEMDKELLEIQEAELDIEKGESDMDPELPSMEKIEEPLINKKQLAFENQIKKYEVMLNINVEMVKEHLQIDLTDKLHLEDLSKLKIIAAFVSFESEQTMKQFTELYSREVILWDLLFNYLWPTK